MYTSTIVLRLQSPYKGGLLIKRTFATTPPIHHLPPPPPREYNEDGTPKRYRNSKPMYKHKYNWEYWTLRPAGMFHTVLVGEFGRQHRPWTAFLLQYPSHVVAIPFILTLFTMAFIFQNSFLIGIKPKRYTIEWIEAQKERELAENTNPITRYLDRRRRERGSTWMLRQYMPSHPYFVFLGDYYKDPDAE
ncbi:CG8 [Babesia bovis T2Bo]|uniref:CG8 n=1 Tax=Babesia bovis TaxID=5865 RepID=A7ATZ7_BABBO|nr:CG8 [Babesia bovis T2Bo]EDO06408.1 CG8 [Babesia bovis T2Bo]|eukprot:XP_001609976.1 CG8 [Babesia bovis]